MQKLLAWGYLKGIGMIVAGLTITFVLAMMLESRAENRQSLAAAAAHNQAMLQDTPLVTGVPKETLTPVEFTPDFVAGR